MTGESVVQDTSQIASHLRDNGLEALEFGVEALTSKPDDRKVRVALREIGSGIELLLKGILAEEHWSLVFEQPANASFDGFLRGDFKSAGFEECLQRLQSIAGLSVTEKQLKRLRSLRGRRNKFEHLGILDSIHALHGCIGGALNAIADLVKAAEKSRLLTTTDLHRELVVTFTTVTTFVDERWKQLSEQIERDAGDPCPVCEQFAGVVRHGLDCLFCGTHSSPTDAADAFLELESGTDPTDGEWPRHDCPACEESALVDTGWSNHACRYRCFGCNRDFASGDLDICTNCDNLFMTNGDEGPSTCRVCSANMLNSDD